MKTEDIVTKVEDALAALGDKIGQGADHFYPIYVQQHFIEGCAGTLLLFLALLLFLGLAAYAIKSCVEDIESGKSFILGMCSLVLFMILCGIIGTHGSDFITKIFNPEYHAAQDILQLLK